MYYYTYYYNVGDNMAAAAHTHAYLLIENIYNIIGEGAGEGRHCCCCKIKYGVGEWGGGAIIVEIAGREECYPLLQEKRKGKQEGVPLCCSCCWGASV